MRGYTQLTEEQRYQIHALMKAGHYPTEIATIIDVHKSTISRESARNRGLRGYRPTQAHRFAMNRRQYQGPTTDRGQNLDTGRDGAARGLES